MDLIELNAEVRADQETGDLFIKIGDEEWKVSEMNRENIEEIETFYDWLLDKAESAIDAKEAYDEYVQNVE